MDMILVTRFADGTEVVAVPEPDASAIEALHDVTHHVLAKALRLPHSPTLWRLAHGEDLDTDLTRYEEAAVLAITKLVEALRQTT